MKIAYWILKRKACVVTINFDPTALLNYYTARNTAASVGTSTSKANSSTSSTAKPTPPWGVGSIAAKPSDLAKNALNGGKLISTSAAKLSVQSSDPIANADYKQLFATYQGLTALEQLAEQAASPTIGAAELEKIKQTFASGIDEVTSHIASSPFKGFKVATGTVAAQETSTVTRPSESDTYTTGTIFTGTLDQPVPAFTGSVAFTMTVAKPSNQSVTVNFDLSEMGSTPRTIPDVVNYLNSKLKAAGLSTRFSDIRTPAAPQTITSGGKTYTTPAGSDSFALKITGTTSEGLTLSAPTATPAVYMLQTSGTTSDTKALTATGLQTVPANAVQQFVKLNADQTSSTPDLILSKTLAAQTTAARATATGPDGSVYVVSDVTGHAADNEVVKGSQDTVLTKYDSAGNVVFTRTLGASSSASGYALAVSADGKKVALASSVTGALDSRDGTVDATQSDTTLSVFDTTSGDETWTTRAGTSGGSDHPTSVAFAADGSVYLSGDTSARFNGQVQTGTQDGFVQGFTALGVAKSAIQFGAAGINSTNGVAISGNQVFVAATEDGHAILRRYDISATGGLSLGLQRDLGELQGGNVAGVAINSDGSVIVAGTTHNAALDAGTITTPYASGRQTFVAKLGTDGAASATDQLSYYNPGGDATATGITASNGKVYVAGQVTGPANVNSKGLNTHQGYVAAIDPTNGSVSWSTALNGVDGQDLPNSIAVGATGASALDKFGLPQGAINYTPPTKLVDISALRAGDQMSIAVGTGSAIKVTVSANDTVDSLASKIQLASGYNLTTQSIYTTNGYAIQIKPANARSQVTLVAGPDGQDALTALGFTAGLVTSTANSIETVSKTSSVKIKPYALGLTPQINLDDSNAIKHAQAQLLGAQSILKKIYSDMTTKPTVTTTSPSGGTTSGKVPSYVTAQIANYKAGLSRLTGGG